MEFVATQVNIIDTVFVPVAFSNVLDFPFGVEINTIVVGGAVWRIHTYDITGIGF